MSGCSTSCPGAYSRVYIRRGKQSVSRQRPQRLHLSIRMASEKGAPSLDQRREGLERGSEPPVKRPRAPIPTYPQIRRRGYGTKGREVNVICNHFAVKFEPRESVRQYAVTITTAAGGDDRLLKSALKRKILESVRDTHKLNPDFVYDGEASLFVAGDLGFQSSKEFPVTLLNRRDTPDRLSRHRGNDTSNDFLVKIHFATVVDMNAIAAVNRGERDSRAQDAIRVLDILLRELASKKSYILQRDCFFSSAFGNPSDLSGGIESWKGVHASFRTTQNGLSLNFDTATTVMIKEMEVIKFIEEYLKKMRSSIRDEDYLKCRRILKGILVKTYLGQTHKIIGFSPEPCDRQTFELKKRDESTGAPLEGQTVSVADYFSIRKQIPLKYPKLRALDVGRPKKPMYLPIELCTIVPGQRYRKLLNTAQRQMMIADCKLNPDMRVRRITSNMEKNTYDREELLKSFHVSIDTKMTRLKARILEAPQLQYGNRVKEAPRNGRWSFQNRTMNQPIVIERWIVVCFRNRRRVDASRIGNELKEAAALKGMKFGLFSVLEEGESDHFRKTSLQRVNNMIDRLRGEVIKIHKDDEAKVANVQSTGLEDKEANIQSTKKEWPFILVILPEKIPDLYVPFKKVCETEIGVVTQCIVPPNGVVNPKYLSSVTLKINLKLGGYNSILASEEAKTLPKISKVPTIIFGLDVSHGSPGDANSPSVAAAVATVEWPRFSKYTCSIRAQEPKSEIIDGLYSGGHTGMVIDLLKNFLTSARDSRRPVAEQKPQQILVYRDGVSESQFSQVLEKEFAAFKEACNSLDSGRYKPKITYVVVQKRHHTRFFQESTKANVLPGTVVDTAVCHPRDNDFYLVSHAAAGTSRPAHYHVLWDEIGFTADELQSITNGLCYTYGRCTSAVSICAPAYYAHIAAAHCRSFVDTSVSDVESNVEGEAHARRSVDLLPNLLPSVLKRMFYA